MMRLRGGNFLPWVTSELAPTMLSSPISQPLSSVLPMPMRQCAPMVAPWTMTPCPTMHSRPMATIGAHCLIGMGSTLLNGCEIGDESIVGANSLVTQGKKFPPRSLIMGSPAKVVREVTDEDLKPLAELHDRYA